MTRQLGEGWDLLPRMKKTSPMMKERRRFNE
jgi:hypothetical protein